MSNNLRSLLQGADPIPHEVPLSDTQREQLRLSVVRDAAVVRSTRPVAGRRNVATTLAVAVIGLMALGYGIWVRGTTPVLAAVRFEVRLAEDQPVQGLVVAQVPDSNRLIYLHAETVVNNDDIAQSWMSQDGPDRFSVSVQLSPSGAERMKQATAMHVGRPMAILIDGSVVMAPVLRGPIGDAAVIAGNFTRAEAERIAEGMKLR